MWREKRVFENLRNNRTDCSGCSSNHIVELLLGTLSILHCTKSSHCIVEKGFHVYSSKMR